MTTGLLLTFALLLDAIMGEPRWLWGRLPHPAVLMGRAIGMLDRSLNSGAGRKAKGLFAITCVVLAAGLIGWALSLLGPLVTIAAAAILLAHKSLIQHVAAVGDGLRLSPKQGRRAVAMIVGRDTKDMETAGIARAAIESGAENLSDGVVAPAFWFLIGGLPGLVIYKAVNTADSMIGYRTPRYGEFGWAAARLDDVLNWVPARLTAVMIALPTGHGAAWRNISADARKHRSPNAGWPEAAMARAINTALSGPRAYDGERQSFPWVHVDGNLDPHAPEIDKALHMMWQAWAVLLFCAALTGLITL